MNTPSLNLLNPRRMQTAIEGHLSDDFGRNEPLLGDCLVYLGVLTPEQIDKALTEQQCNGGLFGEAVIRLKMASRDQVYTALALQDGYLNPVVSPVVLPKGLALLRRPNDIAAERIRLLRTKLLTMQTAEQLSLFSIIPAAYNVRAEFIACNLAAAFAQLGRKTLLVDADLRKPRVRRFLNLKPHKGLASALAGKAAFTEIVQETIVANLFAVTASPQKNNPQELLAADRLPTLFKEMAQNFDSVIVLSAPNGREGDGQFAWSATGAGLVVARRNVTRFHELKTLQSTLRQLDVSVFGAAMTR